MPNTLNKIAHQHVTISPSTNTQLLTDIKSGDIDSNHPYVLSAESQTSGRGQHGRTWQSPKGNVYLSLYHPLDVPLSGILSLIVGYHLTKIPIIQQLNHKRLQAGLNAIGVKWANDIGFYDNVYNYDTISVSQLANEATYNSLKFNKLAGILIEPVLEANKLKGVVIGVGINVLTTPTLSKKMQEGLPYQAVSLAELYELNQSHDEHQQDISTINSTSITDINSIYEQIVHGLCLTICQFTIMQQTQQTADFLDKFNQVNALKDKHIRVVQEQPNTLIVHGIVKGVNEQGSLQVQQKDETVVPVFTGKIERVN